MQGHLKKRSKDSWTVVVELGRDAVTGKRRQLWRTVKGTKRDAEALLVQLLYQRETGVDAPPGKINVEQYLTRWLRDYAEVNVAPRTHERYEQIVRVHLSPALGSIALSKLRPLQIQGAYRTLLEKPLSARTVLHCHRVLREALAWAVRWQMLSRNPADAVEPPRPVKREMRAMAQSEIETLLQAARGTGLYAIVFMAMSTGLRQGELLALRWGDADLKRRTIQVMRTLQYVSGNGLSFGETKTHRSRRRVSLSGETVRVLSAHRRQQLEGRVALGPAYHDDDLVFADATGAPMPPYTLSRQFRMLVQNIGLAPLRFHDLRHAHATLMLQAGVHPKVVSERLGHSGVAITLDTYSHVLPDLQAEAANLIDRYLTAAGERG